MVADESVTALIEEYKRMRAGLSATVETWSQLENSLSRVLAAAMNTPFDQMPFAIYYAPSNTESRLAIVDNAVYHIPLLHGEIPQAKACWDKLFSKINNAKSTRNKIIHGQIVTANIGGGNHCRLTGAMFDFSKRNKTAEAFANKQLPGMSAHDVERAAALFARRSNQCSKLAAIFKAMINQPDEPQAWRKTLAALEADLNLTLNTDGPTPTAQ